MRNKKSLLYLLIVLIFSAISCKKKSEPTPNPEPTIQEKIIGMYDGKQYITNIFNSGGSSGPFIHDKVLEVQQIPSSQNFNFFVDGNWETELAFNKIYDNVMYMDIGHNSGLFTSDNILFECEGWYSTIADYPASNASFQVNKNNKIEVCIRYYNLKNATTQEPLDYWIIVYYEGNKRQ